MKSDNARDRVAAALRYLCTDLPTRTLGTEGNRSATRYVEEQLAAQGWRTQRQEFACLDWVDGGSRLSAGQASYAVDTGPYSPPCAVEGRLVACSSVEAIEDSPDLTGCILLLHGPAAAEQLMPRNFPFYNPEEHQRFYAAVEGKHPAAVIAATGRNPELAGGIYPFPLFEDGDFDIPSACMTDVEGQRLLAAAPARVQLTIVAERHPSTGWNVVARMGEDFPRPIILCAHIDAKAGTPGAIDNAAGVVTLMLTAARLDSYNEAQGVELVIFNGEDHYSAAGETEYLRRLGEGIASVRLVINVDGAGYRGGRTAWSLYGCPPAMEELLRGGLSSHAAMVEGEPWYQSDHGMFVQAGVPALAFTTDAFADVWARIAHTAADTPELVDCDALVTLAGAIHTVILAVATE